jgi:hypothetical protein
MRENKWRKSGQDSGCLVEAQVAVSLREPEVFSFLPTSKEELGMLWELKIQTTP